MTQKKWEIRQKYIEMVKRYDNTKDLAKKTQMKYKFIEWICEYRNKLTEAELEYLQKSICYVEDIYF